MKNVLFSATALTALLAAPLAAANGPIDGKVYGKINVSVVNTDKGSSDKWELKSNASRIGLKGSTEISEGLSVFYKTEFEIAVDDGSFGDSDKTTLKQRNIFAGIKGQYGSLLAGKNDTPTKLAQKKIDLFNDLDGDFKAIFKPAENLASNIITYTTPKYGNFSASYAVMPKEDTNGGLADSKSYSVNYNKDGLYLAVAADSNVKADLLRAVSQYKFGAWQIGLMYQDNDSAEESGYFASAAYKSGNVTYKAQYGVNEEDNGNDEDTTLSLGVDLKLAKKTKAYLFFTDNEKEIEEPGGVAKVAESFGIGIEHKF
jgi:predicted porin